jgi:tetratricopeptide (TPR) repeat protein
MKSVVLGFLQADVNNAAERLAISLKEQMVEDEKKIKALLLGKSDKDVLYIFTQCCNSLTDIQVALPALIFKLFIAVANGPEIKQILADYLLSSDELISCVDEHFDSLFSDADPKSLRLILTSFEARECPNLKISLLEKLISKIQTPYWEHYHLATEYSALEKHSEALSHYNQFYEQAVSRGDQNPTKHGLVGILRSVFYVPEQLAKHNEYFDKAPKEVQEDKDIQVLIKDLTLISECKTALKQKSVVDEKKAGYQYLTKDIIQERINALTKATTVAPSHQSFYELFKLQAMLNNKEKAKELLKNAYQANTLLLSVD